MNYFFKKSFILHVWVGFEYATEKLHQWGEWEDREGELLESLKDLNYYFSSMKIDLNYI